jgi:3-methyl-2-oxobutanoate hydroxymethyltransferase
MTILDFKKKKLGGEKITVVTCYDYWSAKIIDETPIDAILVGDSLAMVMHGHNSTLPATVDLMCSHISAVARGAKSKFIIGDMPFLSFRKGLSRNMDAADKMMKAGSHALKLEGAVGNEKLIHHMVESGIPVMGHIGLTPQSVHQLGGYKVQGKTDSSRDWLKDQAKRLEQSGCFSVVLECVPQDLAAEISSLVQIPTIGIGAGQQTDGQVLVLQDMLGFFKDVQPKFVRRFMNGYALMTSALEDYVKAVKAGDFPSQKESYAVNEKPLPTPQIEKPRELY